MVISWSFHGNVVVSRLKRVYLLSPWNNEPKATNVLIWKTVLSWQWQWEVLEADFYFNILANSSRFIMHDNQIVIYHCCYQRLLSHFLRMVSLRTMGSSGRENSSAVSCRSSVLTQNLFLLLDFLTSFQQSYATWSVCQYYCVSGDLCTWWEEEIFIRAADWAWFSRQNQIADHSAIWCRARCRRADQCETETR